ncbi:MAG: lysyl oxidase family protein [Anaerolineales bacterium]
MVATCALLMLVGLLAFSPAAAGWIPAAALEPTATAVAESGSSSSEISLTLPDLVTLPPTDVYLVQNATRSFRIVRFSNSIANVGDGPLEIAGTWRSAALGYEVRQRLFTSVGELALEPLLSAIDYHPEHGHWHLESFARYELWSTVDGSLFDIVRTSGKVSYCLMDTDRQPVAPTAVRGYASCGPRLQGISAGWADTYRAHIPGQWIDIAGLPSGVYALRSVVNPNGELSESRYDNNVGIIFFRLTDDRLTSIDGPVGVKARPAGTGPLEP